MEIASALSSVQCAQHVKPFHQVCYLYFGILMLVNLHQNLHSSWYMFYVSLMTTEMCTLRPVKLDNVEKNYRKFWNDPRKCETNPENSSNEQIKKRKL